MSGREGIGKRIRQLRLQRGWSQRALAARTGMRGSQISKHETGLSDPKPVILSRIAEALETTTDFLITGHDPGTSQDAHLRALLPALELLPGELRRLTSDFLECLIQTDRIVRLSRKSSPDRPA